MTRDNDNTTTTARDLGVFPFSSQIISDSVNSTDDPSDFYRINVAKPMRLGATLIPKSSNVDLILRSVDGSFISSSAKSGTTADSINAETLAPGVYFLQVVKPDSGNSTYDLSVGGAEVSQGNLSVNVQTVRALQKFDPDTVFGNFFQADFQISTNIQGELRKSKVFGNDDSISPNFITSKSIDLNQRFIPVSIVVTDHDPGPGNFDDFADFNPSNTNIGSQFEFDTVTGKLRSRFGNNSGGFGSPKLEGEVIVMEGDGKGAPTGQGGTKKARVSFQVSYDAFTASSSAFSDRTPVIAGTSSRERLLGASANGILCGEGGSDMLSGMGGNDVLCGGAGNDTQLGGRGQDISFGGAGRDAHIGGAGQDTFVLTLDNGTDIIRDFQNGVDKLGLPIGFDPALLDVVQRGKHTEIGIGNQRIAILTGVKANQIETDDFVVIDFSHFRGIEVPTLVA